MPAETPISNDSPLMKWWNEYKDSESYKNSKRWAVNPEHTEGSLWAAFVAGWEAAAKSLKI